MAGPLDAERQAEHDMWDRAIRRPKWQSKAGQVIYDRELILSIEYTYIYIYMTIHGQP